ncbi:hypothetical protein G6F57_017044 [Rhizopus arrhizus]|nr:hypothetical protein G6F57_017044 [Rhizopus arrhizus]
MLFDEVTSALDPELTGEVLKTIEELARQGMTMLLVTHEMAFAARIADQVIFMHKGQIHESGSREILRQPATPELRSFVGSGLCRLFDQETSMSFKLKNLLFGVTAGLALAVAAQSAVADTLDTIQQRKKILVAIDVGNPPHGMMDANFKPVGSDVETARLLAKDMGVELEIVQVTAPNRVQYLLSKQAAIVVSALSITDERKKVIDYSTPYAELQSIVAAPAAMDIKSYADLSGKSVARAQRQSGAL